MIRLFRTIRKMGAVAACATTLIGGTTMAQPVNTPVKASTEFLQAVGHSSDWLDGALTGMGVYGDFSRDGDDVRLQTPKARRAFNRIRAFAEITVPGGAVPFVEIVLSDRSGAVQSCVTPYAMELVPNLAFEDFGQLSFPQSNADTKSFDQVTCIPLEDARSAGLPLDFKLVFDEHGMLLPDHDALKDDPHFLHALIAAGFYLSVEDYSGGLQIE